jgi:hypothetical protein
LQKAELTSIVDLACSNWGSPDGGKVSLYRTWWRYLADLEYSDALKTVDGMILENFRWMPRVGEIRRVTIDRTTGFEKIPDVERAWFLAAQRWEAVTMGIDPPGSGDEEIDKLIGIAMRETGTPEKRAFVSSWANVLQRDELERYALPEDAPEVLS